MRTRNKLAVMWRFLQYKDEMVERPRLVVSKVSGEVDDLLRQNAIKVGDNH